MKPRSYARTASISLVALLLSSFLVIANSGVSHAISTGSDEVAAASGSNRFVVWQDGKPSNLDIFFRRSTDNGGTWQATRNLSNNPGHSEFPKIAVSGSNLHVVWIQSNTAGDTTDVFYRRSTDNGATWKPMVKITSGGPLVPTVQNAQVVSSGNHVYLVWEKLDGGEIYITRSSDNGATWKPIFNLSSNPGASQFQQIAVSGSNVYVVWHQRNAQDTQSDILFRRSTDNGATWKSKVNLSNTGQAFSPDLALSGSHVHVVWTQPDSALGVNDYQVFIRSSADSGSSWSAAKDLTSEEVEFDFTHPILATSGSHVYVMYEEVVEGCCDAVTDMFFRASHDNGVTWEPAVAIATDVIQNEGSPSLLLAAGSRVYVIWVVADYGGFGDLFFRKSTDYGAAWGPVSADLNNKNRPPRELQAAATGSSIYLVWSNIYPREVYFLRSIDSGASWDSVENISNNLGPSNGPQIGL